MPKCFKFGWILPFVPTPFEQGVWKRHYLECVRGLQYMRPKVRVWNFRDGRILSSIIIYMKKLLDSDWLRAVHSSSVTPVQITTVRTKIS